MPRTTRAFPLRPRQARKFHRHPPPRTTPLENVNAAVATSLDYLKEQLFRLELRHQAGTISDAEYASERARAEKVLRDLVRG